MTGVTSRHPVAKAWRRSVEVEFERDTPRSRLLLSTTTNAFHVPRFGLAVEVRALPPGSIEERWLREEEGDPLTPNGQRVWNALLGLADECVKGAGAVGDLAAVILHPAAYEAARAQLGEKREAA